MTDLESMLSLSISEADAQELLRRIRHQRALREVDLREPDPELEEEIRGRIAATQRAESGFVFECICGRGITTQDKTGTCRGCGRDFDLSAWGS
jgi:hypothetical protein